MTRKKPDRDRDFWTPITAQDPGKLDLSATLEFWIRNVLAEKALEHSAARFWSLSTAKETLLMPDRIYRFLRADEEDFGWCYVSKTGTVRIDEREFVRVEEGEVFSAYVSGEQRCLFEWGVEKTMPDDPLAPMSTVGPDPLGRFPEDGLKWDKTLIQSTS